MEPDLPLQLETLLRNALAERSAEDRLIRQYISDLRTTLTAIGRSVQDSGILQPSIAREQRIRQLVQAVAASVRQTWGVNTLQGMQEALIPWFESQLDFARQMVELSGGTLTGAGTVVANPGQVAAAVNSAIVNGKTLEATLTQAVPALVADRVERFIRLGLSDVAGETFATYADAVVRTTERNVEAIIRTGVHEVGGAAQQLIYELEADQDWLDSEGLVWTAVLDSDVCPVCVGLDGKRFPADYKKVAPHLQCRCVLLPWKWSQDMTDPDGKRVQPTRLSRGDKGGDDYIPVRTAMRDWLKANPETTRQIFGVKRGDALLGVRRDGTRVPPAQRLSLDRAIRSWVSPRET